MPFDPHKKCKRGPGRPPKPKTPAEPSEEPAAADSALVLDGVTFPHVASHRIHAMSDEERARWDAERLQCKLDPLYLGDVLGFDFQENPHRMLFKQFVPMQQPLVDISRLDEAFKKRMILWSRGTFKTSCTIVAILQTILNYPNVRICFLTGSDDLAKRQLLRLRQLFERPGERFKYLFPEFVYQSHQNKRTKEWVDSIDELGTQHDFTVPARTSIIFAEPTFAISTARAAKAGSHWDFIFVDDLVNETNYRSAKMLDRTYEDYLNLVPLLEPSGYIVVTGTRYVFDDPYERIQENAKKTGDATVWKFSIRDCWSSNCANCGCPDVFHDCDVNILQPQCTKCGSACSGFVSDGTTGTLFPPATTKTGRSIGHSLAFLQAQKAELGAANFANQYENRPIAASEQIFTETLIGAQTLFDIQQIPNYFSGSTFVVGDLADSEGDERDQSVLYICRKYQGNIFVFDCRYGRWSSSQLVDNIMNVLIDPVCRPAIVYLEKTLGSNHLNDLVLARATQLGMPKVPLQWIKVGNQKGAKHQRILHVEEALKSKRLWLYAGMPGYQQLVDQLIKWPRIKHDDHADCIGRVIEAPTGYELEIAPQPLSVSNWLRKLHTTPAEDHNYPDSGAGSGIAC